MGDYDPNNPFSPMNDVASMPTSNPFASEVAHLAMTPGAVSQPNPYKPGSEEADAYDRYNQQAATNWAPDMAMTMVGGSGAIPAEANALRTGIGMRGVVQSGNEAALKGFQQFQRLEQKGAAPDINYSITNWYRGQDGQPRYWISDQDAKLTNAVKGKGDNGAAAVPSATFQKEQYIRGPNGDIVDYKPGQWRDPAVGDIWEHPDLYKAYPWLKDVPVQHETYPGWHGSWDPSTKMMSLGQHKPDFFEDVLHHEVVHAIQQYEGFAPGDNAMRFGPEGLWDLHQAKGKLENQIDAQARAIGLDAEEAREAVKAGDEQSPQWQKLQEAGLIDKYKAWKKGDDELDRIYAEMHKQYEHSHGESEARDAPYIRRNPSALKPGKVPLHVNPQIEPGRAITVREAEAKPTDMKPKPQETFAAGGGVQGLSFDDLVPQGGGGGSPSFDDLVPQGGGMAEDIAKSAGTGAVHGLTDFAGTPGNLSNLLAHGSKAAGDYIGGLFGAAPSPEVGAPVLPTTEGINKKIGPLHQAQTTMGKYAESVSEALSNPLTYAGPGGLGGKVLQGVASGVGAEAAGEAFDNNPWARTAGSVIGGPLAGKALNPKLSGDAAELQKAGMKTLTPGEMMGGNFAKTEEKLTSVPALGGMIGNARQRSIEDFNKAAANKALAPVGEKLEKDTAAGHEAIAEVEDKLDQKYNNLIPQLHWTPGKDFAKDMADIQQSAATMPPSAIRQFNKIVADKLAGNRGITQTLTPPPGVTPITLPGQFMHRIWGMQGPEFKAAESELQNLARKYGSSSLASEQLLGDHLQKVVTAMRQDLGRSNPAHAAELGKINHGWAMYSRLRAAAANRVSSTGVFSPGDLLSAIKRGDKSVGKGMFAKGDALMQKFATSAHNVLARKVADSGTTGRGAMMMAPGALAGAGAAFEHAPVTTAATVAGAGLGMGAYSPPGIALLNRLAQPSQGIRGQFGAAASIPKAALTTPFGEGSNPYSP